MKTTIKKFFIKNKYIIIALLATIGASGVILLIKQTLYKNKKVPQKDYDIIMESIENVSQEPKMSKGIALRILSLEFNKAKLANVSNLTEKNACELYENFKKHIEFSCKYSKDQKKCKETVFGVNYTDILRSLKVLGCKI